ILGIGFAFSGQIEHVAERLASLGSGLVVLVVSALAGYIAWKFIARQRFLRELRIARISVEELKQKIDSGEELVIVDLRHSLDFEAEPETIPGAFRMDSKELEEKNDTLPRDREVILYCT
ncbi:MAG: rhodanese-like domain-containing protein, partial [Candidatus Acidiferrales bacterium]